MKDAPEIAYFVNVYPTVSHTFIRREIEALEALGWQVRRFAIRKSADLVDPGDRAEAARTTALLPVSSGGIAAMLGELASRPIRAARAARCAWRMAWRSPQGILRAMCALPEAALLLRHLRRAGIRHVHGHFATNSATVLRLTRELGGPTYSFTVHGPFEIDSPEAWSMTDKVKDALFVIAISEFARAQLMWITPTQDWPKAHVIRCGLALAQATTDLSPVPDTDRLLHVGRLSPEKGQLVLLRAVRALLDRGQNIHLRIIGDGEMRATLERECARLHLGANVELVGWAAHADIVKALRESRALVLSSFAEGLPIVLMESFAQARPVITTRVGAVAELVLPGQNGWLVAPGSSDALADAMMQALQTSTEVLSAMGIAGWQKVNQQHRSEREAMKLDRLFRQALGQRAAGAEEGAGRVDTTGDRLYETARR